MLTLGGWDRSAHFAPIAASPPARAKLVASVVRFALDRRLDGVDLDWEHPQTRGEQENYGKLLVDLRAAFRPHGLLLAVTLAGWPGLSAEAIGAVDYVQVMAYDHDQEHSTFVGAQQDVPTLLGAGVPAGKVVLGVPFYGRDVDSRAARTYAEIVAEHAPAPQTDRIGQLYFNGPETIRRKVRFAKESRLGGVMSWDLGQDAPGDASLLRVIREAAASPAC